MTLHPANRRPGNLTACMWGHLTEKSLSCPHRRRIKTEEWAKVVASVYGEESIQFLAVLAVLHWTIWIIGWIAPVWFERKGWIHHILHNRPRQNSSAARNWINASPKTEATTFAFSSVSVLILWEEGSDKRERKGLQIIKSIILCVCVLYSQYCRPSVCCTLGSQCVVL